VRASSGDGKCFVISICHSVSGSTRTVHVRVRVQISYEGSRVPSKVLSKVLSYFRTKVHVLSKVLSKVRKYLRRSSNEDSVILPEVLLYESTSVRTKVRYFRTFKGKLCARAQETANVS
jgi:hypothetical protein